MNRLLLSVSQWKCLLLAMLLCCAGLNLWVDFHWGGAAVPGVAGLLPVSLGDPDRDYRLPILRLAAGSSLLQAGARPGDTLVFDRAGDIRRNMAVGEAIGVTWYGAGQARHAVLTVIPDPEAANAPRTAQFNYLLDRLFVWAALALSLLIGWRRAEDGSMRVFAILIAAHACDISHRLPAGAFQGFMIQAIAPWVTVMIYLPFAYFALTFPQGQSHWRRAWVRRLFKLYALLSVLVAVGRMAENFGMLPAGLREHLPPIVGKEILAVATVVASLTALWLSWHRAGGVTRQRLAWTSVCLGAIYATYLVANTGLLFGTPAIYTSTYLYIYSAATRPLAFAALGYALLRYRLFDFGFVVNRALAVTILSTLLLLVFAVTEFTVDKLLHFEGREQNVIFDAAVALAIILCFHRIQHWVDHQVNHTFFHLWHEAAEKLRGFLSKAVHITESTALQSKYALALCEFCGAGGIAIFLEAGRGMELRHATLPHAPDVIDLNHDVLIDLRHTRQLVRLDERAQGLPGELALPMMAQGRLRGLVLMGAKANQQQYRPDEIALLASAVQQLGTDLQSLRAAELEQACAALERETALLRQLIHGDGTPALRRAPAHNA